MESGCSPYLRAGLPVTPDQLQNLHYTLKLQPQVGQEQIMESIHDLAHQNVNHKRRTNAANAHIYM
ncbi:hypothetical protein N7537_005603 [Penicillium hordei]|uniref:Uncharacterized protein n=1 Tax=Penicillium hordei TaxID=40994 RepID=A0AAD6E788_9EURO|nr:uncharacterized protein N7537_005603 [Penicillium hordei]KAJ5602647.1 hypothetical protein N7537_005603 [Penicillium hordei]